MGKKLFIVNIAQEIVVLADDEQDAHEIASKTLRDLDWHNTVEPARQFSYYPGDWEPEALPYGDQDDGEKTIGELIQEGHAPAYKLPAGPESLTLPGVK